MTARDKGINAEREFSRQIQAAAGRVVDPVLGLLVTSTGRVGQLTDLGFDFLAGNPEEGTALVGESKRRKTTLGADALRALLQIARIGAEWGRTPVFAIALADNVPAFLPTKAGKKFRVERFWTAIPLPFFCRLLEAQRENAALRKYLLEQAPGLLVNFVAVQRAIEEAITNAEEAEDEVGTED